MRVQHANVARSQPTILGHHRPRFLGIFIIISKQGVTSQLNFTLFIRAQFTLGLRAHNTRVYALKSPTAGVRPLEVGLISTTVAGNP